MYADAHLQAERQCNAAVTPGHPVWWTGSQGSTKVRDSLQASKAANIAMATVPLGQVHVDQPKRVLGGEVDWAQNKKRAVERSDKAIDASGAVPGRVEDEAYGRERTLDSELMDEQGKLVREIHEIARIELLHQEQQQIMQTTQGTKTRSEGALDACKHGRVENRNGGLESRSESESSVSKTLQGAGQHVRMQQLGTFAGMAAKQVRQGLDKGKKMDAFSEGAARLLGDEDRSMRQKEDTSSVLQKTGLGRGAGSPQTQAKSFHGNIYTTHQNHPAPTAVGASNDRLIPSGQTTDSWAVQVPCNRAAASAGSTPATDRTVANALAGSSFTFGPGMQQTVPRLDGKVDGSKTGRPRGRPKGSGAGAMKAKVTAEKVPQLLAPTQRSDEV